MSQVVRVPINSKGVNINMEILRYLSHTLKFNEKEHLLVEKFISGYQQLVVKNSSLPSEERDRLINKHLFSTYCLGLIAKSLEVADLSPIINSLKKKAVIKDKNGALYLSPVFTDDYKEGLELVIAFK